jgi:hypothetical protein
MPSFSFFFLQARTRPEMAIFYLSISPISRAKGRTVVAYIAYDTRCNLTNERTAESSTRPSTNRM